MKFNLFYSRSLNQLLTYFYTYYILGYFINVLSFFGKLFNSFYLDINLIKFSNLFWEKYKT